MSDEEGKPSKLDQRPRAMLGPSERPSMPGHIGTDEAHEFMVPKLFGQGFPRENLIPTPYSISELDWLGSALATGQRLVICEKLLNALVAGGLTMFAAGLGPDGNWESTHRIPANVFADKEPRDVGTEFLLSCAGPIFSAFPDWLRDKTLFLHENEFEAWLDCLEPLACLPKTVERQDHLLPERHINASEAICWIAGQDVCDWYGLIEVGGDLRDTLSFLERQRDQTSGYDYDAAAVNAITLLAEKQTRSHAANEILRLMREGKLVGFGARYKDHDASFQAIPQTAFLVQREFCSLGKFIDCLAPAKTDDGVENEQAGNEEAWTHVRFDRDALVEIWGHNVKAEPAKQDSAASSSARKRKPEDLPVRIPKMRAAKEYSAELEKQWGRGEAQWRQPDFVEYFRENFDLSRDEARELWQQLPQVWRRRGRPRQD